MSINYYLIINNETPFFGKFHLLKKLIAKIKILKVLMTTDTQRQTKTSTPKVAEAKKSNYWIFTSKASKLVGVVKFTLKKELKMRVFGT